MRKVLLWFEVQKIYMPCVLGIRSSPLTRRAGNHDSDGDDPLDAALESAAPETATKMRLLLPSALTPEARATLPRVVIERYAKIRVAQAEDALQSMKKTIRRGAALFQYKKSQVGGTGVAANTRMYSAIKGYTEKTELFAQRYRRARNALIELDPSFTFTPRLRVLEDNDVRPFTRQEKESEGRRTLSWIWMYAQGSIVERDHDDSGVVDESENTPNNDAGSCPINAVLFVGAEYLILRFTSTVGKIACAC